MSPFYTDSIAKQAKKWLVANGFAAVCPACGETVHFGPVDGVIAAHGNDRDGRCPFPGKVTDGGTTD